MIRLKKFFAVTLAVGTLTENGLFAFADDEVDIWDGTSDVSWYDAEEVNLISWNEREPKYDIRDWAPDHSRMGKGITLTADEMAALKDLLNTIDFDSFE